MISVPEPQRHRLIESGQTHVLTFWDQLDDEGRRRLLADLDAVSLDELSGLYALRDQQANVPPPEKIQPAPFVPHRSADNAARRQEGEAALRRGEVAALVVAGGQGSRLGFEHPKGMFPVGPVSGKTLFHFHAEKVLAVRRRYACRVPYLVMTSPATNAETIAFFEGQGYFGLPREDVHFFQQAVMPALDLSSGRLLLESADRLFLSPDGHGGTLTALAKTGLLARLEKEGIKQVFYFQVDNPLVKIADPILIGHHLHHKAEVSSKVVAKTGAKEKMGVFALVDGRCCIVEYSDLPDDLAAATDDAGRLLLWAGNPAIHLFEVAFLNRMTREALAPGVSRRAKEGAAHQRGRRESGADERERGQVRAVHFRCIAGRPEVADRGVASRGGVRSVEERGGGGLPGDGGASPDRTGGDLDRKGGGARCPGTRMGARCIVWR